MHSAERLAPTRDEQTIAAAPRKNGIFENTVILVSYTVVETVVIFLFTVLLARSLGADGFGRLAFALSYALLTSVLADPGLSTAVMKLAARSSGSVRRRFVGNGLRYRLLLSGVIFAASLFPFALSGYMRASAGLILAIVVSEHIRTFTLYLCYMFRTHQQTQFEALSLSIERFGCLVGAFILFKAGFGIRAITLLYLGTRIASFLVAACIYFRMHGTPIFAWGDATRQEIRSETIPLTVVVICDRMSTYLPPILVTAIAGEYSTGLFQAAYKLVMPAMFVCAAISGTLYAPMSAAFVTDPVEARKLFCSAIRSVFHLLLPAAAVTLVYAKQICVTFYGAAYLPSSSSLQWLTPYFVFTGIISVSLLFLTAADRQVIASAISTASVVIMSGLGVCAITWWGISGAALSMAIAQACSVAAYLYAASQYTDTRLPKRDWVSLAVSYAFSLCACLSLRALVHNGLLSITLGTIASYVSYFASHWLIDGFSIEERRMLERAAAALAITT